VDESRYRILYLSVMAVYMALYCEKVILTAPCHSFSFYITGSGAHPQCNWVSNVQYITLKHSATY